MKLKLKKDNIHVEYYDAPNINNTCLSFAFETKGLLPLHLYQQIGMDSRIVDVSIVLEVLKRDLMDALVMTGTGFYARTFMGMFSFSVIFNGGMKLISVILKTIHSVLHEKIQYSKYAQLCKALKIRYDNDFFMDAIYQIEQSIKKRIWFTISGKKVYQASYKNGDTGFMRLEKLFENYDWTSTHMGKSRNQMGRSEMLWKKNNHKMLRINANYLREWENLYTPVILYNSLLEKLTFPTSPEGYCPVIEPSGFYLYYRTRRPIKEWFKFKDLHVAEKWGEELWFHWANCRGMLMSHHREIYETRVKFKLPNIYEEIKTVCASGEKYWFDSSES